MLQLKENHENTLLHLSCHCWLAMGFTFPLKCGVQLLDHSFYHLLPDIFHLSQEPVLHANCHLYHPMPLDLSYKGHDPDPTDDSIESVQEDNVNESLGCLEEENPNLADLLTDLILDHAATSLECWFCTPTHILKS